MSSGTFKLYGNLYQFNGVSEILCSHYIDGGRSMGFSGSGCKRGRFLGALQIDLQLQFAPKPSETLISTVDGLSPTKFYREEQ